jgi:hypothetical protein
VRTLPALESAHRCFKSHTAPGGVIIVEPWFPPGKLTPGPSTVRRVETDNFRVERTATTELDVGVSRLRFDYTVETAQGVQHFSEVHELGLFSEEETLLAFKAAALSVTHDSPSAPHRGLDTALRGPRPVNRNRNGNRNGLPERENGEPDNGIGTPHGVTVVDSVSSCGWIRMGPGTASATASVTAVRFPVFPFR